MKKWQLNIFSLYCVREIIYIILKQKRDSQKYIRPMTVQGLLLRFPNNIPILHIFSLKNIGHVKENALQK